MAGPTVIDALRQFLPRFLTSIPSLSAAQWRAVNAIRQCRTPALGGHLYLCPDCDQTQFAWHSCNHKACPLCGRVATAAWVSRQLEKLAGCPYFMVTFTLPEQLRGLFFGDQAREMFDLFFAAASTSLAHTLASPKWLGARLCGSTAALHTWNQRLLFHPHLHFILPGAGLRSDNSLCQVKSPGFLVPIPALRDAFKEAFRIELDRLNLKADPAVWSMDWGVHIQPCGTGTSAVKYLGAYVARTAIGDARILALTDEHVIFRFKDRAKGGRHGVLKLDGIEFVRRYLRHVLPPRMHSIRHFGFCHPAAKRNRERVRFLTGMPLILQHNDNESPATTPPKPAWLCPCCGRPMRIAACHPRVYTHGLSSRPPPDSS